jgi:hypothetical protein
MAGFVIDKQIRRAMIVVWGIVYVDCVGADYTFSSLMGFDRFQG